MAMICGGCSKNKNWRRAGFLIGAFILLAMPLAGHTAAAKLRAPSSYVFDLQSNAMRTATRAEIVRPIASLTKLMTAIVLLDARADLEKKVVYDPKKHAAYKNWMKFRKGDRLSGRDLFYATLIGSQNITARMLMALTPYTEQDFVARMNAKARSLGLTQTAFVDVHGLSPKNVSTAAEVARLFEIALGYSDIADVLARPSAKVVITSSRGVSRVLNFSHTNPLLAKRQPFATEASKTGYLNEAGDAIAMLVRDPRSSRKFTIVTLGESRRSPRFSLAKRLAAQVTAAVRTAGK